MDDGKKKIWICLLVVVLAAVGIGVLYYFSVPSENGSEGFLLLAEECRGVTLLSEEARAEGI